MAEAISRDGAKFIPAEPKDFSRDVCVVAQAVDNQWVPSSLLSRITEQGLTLEKVREEYERFARAEYLRALINSERVIINRAFIHNTFAVHRDFLPTADADATASFKYLLEKGSIVPSLFREESPHEPPPYTVDPAVLQAWHRVCLETEMKCLRLSWDAATNKELTYQLIARRFNEFVDSFKHFNEESMAADLNLPKHSENALRIFFRKVSRFSLDFQDKHDKLPSREDYYRSFIVAPDTEPRQGIYDGSKEFSGALKQLIDLAYNVSGADALGQYTLSPIDSLPRTALQELSFPQAGGVKEMDPGALAALARKFAFEITQKSLGMKSLHLLSLTDVKEIRRTESWGRYCRILKEFLDHEFLLEDPEVFYDRDAGAPAVVRAYQELAGQLARRMQENVAAGPSEEWNPVCETKIEAPGASVTLKLNLGVLSLEVKGSISELWKKAVPVAYRFGVRPAKGYAMRFATLFNIRQMKMSHPREQWDALIKKLKEIPGIREEGQTGEVREPVAEKAE